MPLRFVVALAGAVAIAVSLPMASATSSRGTVMKFELKSKVADAQGVDHPPEGASAGDGFVFTETLTDAEGKKAGTDAAVCTRLFDERSLCDGVYRLRGGQIMVQLLQPGPTGTYTQAITGGTGRYTGATGKVTVRQDPAKGDRFSFAVRVP